MSMEMGTWGVCVGVSVDMGVGVASSEGVAVGVSVDTGVGVASPEGVAVGVSVDIGVGVASPEGVAVGVSVDMGVGVASPEGVLVGVSVDIGVGVVSSVYVDSSSPFSKKTTHSDNIKIITRDGITNFCQWLFLSRTWILASSHNPVDFSF